MLSVRFVRKGKDFPQIIKDFEEVSELAKVEIKELAEKATAEMKKLSAEHTRELRDHSVDKNPQASRGRISENIEMKVIEETEKISHYGVGEIAKLKKEAPHWAAINFGSSHIVNKAVKGHFTGDKGVFYANKPWYKMIPKKGITAKNYIERTQYFVMSRIKEILLKLRGGK